MVDKPIFIERDPATVEASLIALWEQIADKPLFPAQPERLLINLMAYRESLLRVAIQYTAEQQLVNFATGANLDQLGALVDTARLAASPATVNMAFVKQAGFVNTSLTINAGTLVATQSGVLFATDADLLIASGVTSRVMTATCTQAGLVGNGFAPGQINRLFAGPITGIQSVSNTGNSTGGGEIETDDRYRLRIKLAPEAFSVAGSAGAYKYHTLAVAAGIIDVAVVSPSRGQVNIYPLTETGAPSGGLVTDITTALSSDQIRPLTDMVSVFSPTAVNFTISASVTLYAWADLTNTEAAINAAAAQYAAAQRSKLGSDIIRNQIIETLFVEGVYNLTLSAPSTDTTVTAIQWANCTSITINIAGVNAG